MGQREITARSDIYSLGAMTYEMLVGEPPISGPSAQAIVARVMTEAPAPPSRHRDTVPEAVDDAVLTALAKFPADRFATAAEFAAALTGDGISGLRLTRERTRIQPAPPKRSRVALYGGLALAALLAMAAIVALIARPRTGAAGSDAPITRFVLQPGPGSEVASPVDNITTYLALSPDGRQVVYAAQHGGPGWALDIRRLDQLHARTLPGTEGGTYPEFSPDGRWIAFGAADGSLRKVAADGSGLSTLAPLDAGGVNGITWTSDREIVFARLNLAFRGLWRVPADGGEPVRFTRFDSATGERLQIAPRAADGGRLVFYSSSQATNLDLHMAVVPMEGGVPKVFTALGGGRALGVAEGFLLYVRTDGALMAAPFDSRTLEAGAPLRMLDSIAANFGATPAALSANGSLLYQRGGLATQVVRVDHRGVASVLLDSARVYGHPRLSPDGRRLAVELGGDRSNEIWIADLTVGTLERLTREGFSDRPEWSPDGTRILYSSSRSSPNALWWQPADGSGPAELVYQGPDAIREGVFTPDGGSIVFRSDTPDSNRDVFRLSLSGEREPVPILTGVNDDKHPRVSPDGRLLAYTSNETGREEVYLRALSGRAARVRVSTGGGGAPLWSPEGRQLYYRTGAAVMVANVTASPALAITRRDTLFTGRFTTSPWHQNYDVTPDGKSFVMLRPVEEQQQLVMVLNWIEELRRRLARP